MYDSWLMHPQVFQAFDIGRFKFLKMSAEETIKYIDSLKSSYSRGNYYLNQNPELYEIYNDPKSIIVSVNDGKLDGLTDSQLSKIEDKIGADVREKVNALFGSGDKVEEVLYIISGEGVAHIPVTGVLRRGRVIDSTYQKWGSSTYNEIITASQFVDNDTRVKDVVYDHNSPGGGVDGCDQAALAIMAVQKPKRADVHFWSMSASFKLAAMTKYIRALTPEVQVGSVGVVYSYYDWEKYYKEMGLVEHTITSDNAPDKRPGVKRLDKLLKQDANELEELFIGRLSVALSLSVDHIKKNFGRGWDKIASKALQSGMIHEIKGVKSINDTLNSTEGQEDMDYNELKKEHPSLYTKVVNEGKELGVIEGQASALVDVKGHLAWIGKATNKTIIANIEAGKACDNTCVVAYSEEHQKAFMTSERTDDDDGHENTDTEIPGEEGAKKAGMKKGGDKEDNGIEDAKLDASLKKLGLTTEK